MVRTLLSAAIALALGAGVALAQGDDTSEPEAAAKAEKAKPMQKSMDESMPAASAAKLKQLAVCTSVEERTPVGEAETFPSDVGKLWCFTWLTGAKPPMQIYHRWFVGDQLVNEIPIDVRGGRWRCWSTKTILPSWSGPCHVEIATESGDILGTKEFTLTAAAKTMGGARAMEMEEEETMSDTAGTADTPDTADTADTDE
jgi:hypothetical protein